LIRDNQRRSADGRSAVAAVAAVGMDPSARPSAPNHWCPGRSGTTAGGTQIDPARTVRHTVRVPPPGTTPIDDALVACADGDAATFGAVYDALAPVAHGTALAVLRDPDHAAEVTQEVMVEVWQTAARFDPARASARTWVATLARRRAVDRVRSEQSRRDRDQRDVDSSRAGADRDVVAEDVERRLEGAAVRRCLDSLTPTQREAVVDAYYGGRTYREVADRLGAALPTVKSRIRDGLGRLRDCLGVNRG
jgi:RNA polymerase sigma-70 factor (ECF subfamily)